MKLELIKQIDPVRQETWFIVKLDGESTFFPNEADAKRRYDILKELGSAKKEEIILESVEINVPLEENN